MDVLRALVLLALALAAMAVGIGAFDEEASDGPPDEIFGAKRAFCEEAPAATCCGYEGVDHEGDPCGIVLCRGNSSDEWHIVMAQCFRGKPKAAEPPKTEETL
jgi:hypothetical protein